MDGFDELALPFATNLSACQSKTQALAAALDGADVRVADMLASVVFAGEFNRIVGHTGNKSLLLFQKTGLLLQRFWGLVDGGPSCVLVDKHGGRVRYRRLLLDVFPHCRCDVLEEQSARSAYRIHDGERRMTVLFAEGGDARALPTALASMTAKYVRELYMAAFNDYWARRVDGLKPTAGYRGDSTRFLKDIAHVLKDQAVDLKSLVRGL
jgi:hypothetical protein